MEKEKQYAEGTGSKRTERGAAVQVQGHLHQSAAAETALRGGRVRELCGDEPQHVADGHPHLRRVPELPDRRRLGPAGVRRAARAAARRHRLAGVRADGHEGRGLPHEVPGAHGRPTAALHGHDHRRGLETCGLRLGQQPLPDVQA